MESKIKVKKMLKLPSNIAVFSVSVKHFFFHQIAIHGFMNSSMWFHIVTPPNLLGDSACSLKSVMKLCLCYARSKLIEF